MIECKVLRYILKLNAFSSLIDEILFFFLTGAFLYGEPGRLMAHVFSISSSTPDFFNIFFLLLFFSLSCLSLPAQSDPQKTKTLQGDPTWKIQTVHIIFSPTPFE